MGFGISISGILAGLQRQVINANNIANLATPGFRASRGGQATVGGAGGTRLVSTAAQTGPGGLVHTGDPLNAAIAGDGFFVLRGANGEQSFSRAGNFTLNGQGQLTTADGRLVAPGIQIPAGTTGLAIGLDGSVQGVPPGATTPQTFGRIQIARFNNPAGLQSIGGNAFVATAASGLPQIRTATGGTGDAILGGMIEGSNVELVREITDQILNVRSVQANADVIRVQNGLLGTLIDLIR